MLVAHLAEPKEGDEIIDVCAAPGGKALHMAEVLCGTGHVQARDLTEYKVGLIEENILRSGMTNNRSRSGGMRLKKMKLQLKRQILWWQIFRAPDWECLGKRRI